MSPGSTSPLKSASPSQLRLAPLCRSARRQLGFAAAGICLEAPDLHWIDLDARADPRLWTFATSLRGWPAGDGMVAVADATRVPRLAHQPYVAGDPGLRCLVSIPFGSVLRGRLSLYDTRIREVGADEIAALGGLADIAGQMLRLLEETQQALQREADFRILAEASSDTIVRGDLDGVRLYVSPSVEALLGYTPQDLVGKRAIDIVHPDDVPEFRKLMQSIRNGTLDVGICEVRQRNKDGAWVWMEASVRLTYDAETGLPTGYVSSVRGMDRRKAAQAHLEYLASHDALTGLANRALLDQHVKETIAQSGQTGQRAAFLYMDLDRFKQVNDTLGHVAGDKLLQLAAARLRAVVPEPDMVARLGGDEFAVVHPIETEADAARLAERLIAAMKAPFAVENAALSIGLSIGITFIDQAGDDPADIVAAADAALYAAKSAGRNTFRINRG
ncbi:sensor domain-containing diguanylate cyclase [Aquabacter spiritensis]|uniref:PAS domain S-box-containing protein/diguanylate cyclase (GGDEF)-like protein n=1 Tax=Aquabacter spiritensis TaxID=933073 RepID=A0A4R3LVE6_9HYPH|nr:sensor domain-containing diguanylate cyclase [Aquabacter spiritensis]TCT04600.1 PAS domain S-box-containing protein/diguanylate cyclase (GGDEF)-like protein [Aquabacter spiritensis]